MTRLIGYFRRLRWKLTLSYTLVTVAVLIALELLVLLAVGGLLALLLSQAPGIASRELEEQLAPRFSPALASQPPDLAAIEAQLQAIRQQGITTEHSPIQIHLQGGNLLSDRVDILVVGADGRLLGSFQPGLDRALPAPVDSVAVPGLDATLGPALAGNANATPLRWSNPSYLTVAAPIKDPSGTVLGALVFSSPLPGLGLPLRQVTGFLLFSAFVFTLAAGTIGTVFGYFTARGLTRRLDRVTTTASAWGSGDFTPVIVDRSADEIGQLGRQLNRMAERLAELIETRQQLSIVDERNRLARDLHDSVKQQVFAISMNLGAAQALLERDLPAARARIDTAYELARQSQQELTTIIQTLRPVQLETKNLRQALADYLADWRQQTAIETQLEVSGEALPERRVEEAIFRVAQEALANVARHSRASLVRVELALQPALTRLTLRDNGQGFDGRKRASGLGLTSMRERMAEVGGELSVSSGPGGTTVTAQAPRASATTQGEDAS